MKKTIISILTLVAIVLAVFVSFNTTEEIETLFFCDFCAMSIITVSLLSLIAIVAMVVIDCIKKHFDAKLRGQRRHAVRNLADGETYRDKGFVATRKGNVYEWRRIYKAPKGESFRERNARIRKETYTDDLREVLYWISY